MKGRCVNTYDMVKSELKVVVTATVTRTIASTVVYQIFFYKLRPNKIIPSFKLK